MLFLIGCRVNVRGKERPLVSHGPITGEVELRAEMQKDEQTGSSSNRKSDTMVFEERVRVATEGDVYHPNLLHYVAGIGLGLNQQKIDSDDFSDSSSGTLTEYNAVVQILRTKKTPMSIFLDKSDDLVARQFMSPLRSENEKAGVSVAWRSKEWPMRFQYSTNTITQNSLTDPQNDFFFRDDKRFRYSLDHKFSKLSYMNFDFERSDVTRKSENSSTNTLEDRYNLIHNWTFGDSDQYRLGSFFNFAQQTGDFDSDNLRWEELFEIQHTSNFITTYEARYSEATQNDFSNKSIFTRAGFVHDLYESLTTSGSVFMSQPNFDADNKLTQQGATIDFNYRKNNRWGKLLGTYTFNFTDIKQSGGQGDSLAFQEPHVVPAGPAPIVQLRNDNVDDDSIIVENAAGDRFTLNIDYTITRLGNQTWLSLNTLTGGAPPNFSAGMPFFVTYNYVIEEDGDKQQFRQNIYLTQRFDNGLELFIRHWRQNERLSSSDPEAVPDEIVGTTLGAEYYRNGIELLAKVTDEDATQVSTKSRTLEAGYNWMLDSNTAALVRATHYDVTFDSPESRNVTSLDLIAEVTSRLTERYNLLARVDYRDQDDSKAGPTEGFQFVSELEYYFRQVNVIIGLEYDLLTRSDDESNSLFAYFRVRRFF